jgi:hypothetical protein
LDYPLPFTYPARLWNYIYTYPQILTCGLLVSPEADDDHLIRRALRAMARYSTAIVNPLSNSTFNTLYSSFSSTPRARNVILRTRNSSSVIVSRIVASFTVDWKARWPCLSTSSFTATIPSSAPNKDLVRYPRFNRGESSTVSAYHVQSADSLHLASATINKATGKLHVRSNHLTSNTSTLSIFGTRPPSANLDTSST